MKPKEKAKELVDKFIPLAHKNFTMRNDGEIDKAKKCATICVDEIIDSHSSGNWKGIDWNMYWKNVKDEINNL